MIALRFAERGYLAKEMNVGWKEWLANKHPIHQGAANGIRCTCSK
jgi:hypothetical protein